MVDAIQTTVVLLHREERIEQNTPGFRHISFKSPLTHTPTVEQDASPVGEDDKLIGVVAEKGNGNGGIDEEQNAGFAHLLKIRH